MNKNWKYVPFEQLFEWGEKSNIGSRQGKETGKYRLYIASAKEIKYFDEFLSEGESLIFGTGGNPCIHYVTGKYAYTNHTESAKCRNSENTCTKFYYYYFQKNEYNQLRSTFVGGGIKNSSKKRIGALSVPVPCLKEQEQIVFRIEELFSQLDDGIKTLERTKEQLKVYRQAVLKEAFEGKFTETWRKQNQSSTMTDFEKIKKNHSIFKDISGDENELSLNLSDSAIKIRLGEIFEVEVGATPKRAVPEYWNGEINWVSSGEVHFNKINVTKETITFEGVKNSSTSVQPSGTVLLAMIGEGKTRGQAAILNVEAAHNQNTAAILVSKTPCNPKYIYYFLMLNYEHTRRVGSGNNQKALNKERVKALRFPFVSFNEQNEIVKEIESRLSVCDSIEQTTENALKQAEALRQSILKQAFEGELL